jgi:hypothetical protein
MLDRVQKLRQPIGKSAQVFELGPSFNPLAPKSEGWRSFVVDPKAGLSAKRGWRAADGIAPMIRP